MYKRASQNLQRAHRVNRPLPTGGYIGSAADNDDLLPSADNLSLAEVKAEQRQLHADQVRFQADLAAAKARGDAIEVARIGQQIQVLCQRVKPLKARAHALVRQHQGEAIADAVRELCPPDLARAIFDRANGRDPTPAREDR